MSNNSNDQVTNYELPPIGMAVDAQPLENDTQPLLRPIGEIVQTLAPEQAEEAVKEQTEEKHKKEKVSLKERMERIFNGKVFNVVCNILFFILRLVPPILCIVQMVFWGVSVVDSYQEYWNAIVSLDYVNIGILAFMLLFVITMLVHVFQDVIRLITREDEVLFESVSTYFAFFLFQWFAETIFSGKELLISNFTFSPMLAVIGGFMLAYAAVRLVNEDFGARWYPALFSCAAIALVIFMFVSQIGNYATLYLPATDYAVMGPDGKIIATSAELVDLDPVKYIQALVGSSEEVCMEAWLLQEGNRIAANRDSIYVFMSLFINVLVLLQILAAKILPFAALSMVGYLMFGLVSKHYVQFMKINACKKATVSMLVIAIAACAASVGLSILSSYIGLNITFQINYWNAIITIGTCIVLLVLTSMPWKIYRMIYKHRYTAYRKREGGSAYGITTV